MFIRKFDHRYLNLIKNLDIQDESAKETLIETLTFKTIKKKLLIHLFLILITFGYHYYKLRLSVAQAIDEALTARKLNALFSLTETDFTALKQVYSSNELSHLQKYPITDYHLLKILYFQRGPFKYKKIWQSLFQTTQATRTHDIDSINLYYDRLTTSHSVPHEQILKHLRKKVEGRYPTALTTQEIQRAFKELMDSQKAS
ncbi:hypothetical protein [Simkania negevensis]|nr:hypothetical protein [Simkania negevensis]MCB1066990.1 hypothetical protein [Simkania sp.]MCB1075257.1 hypothetical protein [Simkania sp.]